MTKQNSEILETAKEIGDATTHWADLANALFDQETGLVAKAFPTPAERAAFVRSDEYKEIRTLLRKAQEQGGLVRGASPTKSGRLLLRLPRSMHEALEKEADSEGVSLNHLVVAKLAMQFARIVGSGRNEWIPTIVQAYSEIRRQTTDGRPASEDRVVADPDLDARYIAQCHRLGADETDYELNRRLFYARKNGFTKHLPKVPRLSIPRARVDQYEYASEMAVRFVQKKQMEQALREVSLDTIICDPLLVAAFDSFASRLAPSFSPFEYRWAALGLRKAGRYRSSAMDVEVPAFEDLGRTRSLRLDRIPEVQGLYLVQNGSERVFVGETQNLRTRIKRHVDVAGAQLIPTWLYKGAEGETRLSVAPLPEIQDSTIKAMEFRAILSLSPLLNFPRSIAA